MTDYRPPDDYSRDLIMANTTQLRQCITLLLVCLGQSVARKDGAFIAHDFCLKKIAIELAAFGNTCVLDEPLLRTSTEEDANETNTSAGELNRHPMIFRHIPRPVTRESYASIDAAYRQLRYFLRGLSKRTQDSLDAYFDDLEDLAYEVADWVRIEALTGDEREAMERTPGAYSPLVFEDSPERVLILSRYNVALAECIRELDRRSSEPLRVCLTGLMALSEEVAFALSDALESLAEAETRPSQVTQEVSDER